MKTKGYVIVNGKTIGHVTDVTFKPGIFDNVVESDGIYAPISIRFCSCCGFEQKDDCFFKVSWNLEDPDECL